MSLPDPRGGNYFRAMRLVRIALILIALYLIAVNALINTALLEPLVNRKPERFTMQWGRALMLWPGRITLWDVTMHGQARRNVWQIKAERASGHIALWPLLRKELRFSWVRASHPDISVRRVEQELPSPPPSDHGMHLVFDDVQVSSPLRFSLDDVLVLEGQVQAQARWQQQFRGGVFELHPSTLHLTQGQLVRGEREWLRDLTLDAEVLIDAHRRSEHHGIDLLDFLHVDATLSGQTPGFAIDVDEAFDVSHAMHPGEGELVGRIVVDRGVLDTHTDVAVRIPVRAATHAGHQSEGDARLALSASDQAIALQLSLPPVPDLIEVVKADLRLDTPRLPMPPWDAQLLRLNGEIDVHSRFSSLAFVQPLMSRLQGIQLDGRGDVEGRIILERGELAAGTQAKVNEAEFTLMAWEHRFHGAARADARIASDKDGQSTAVAQVKLDRFDITPANEPGTVLGSGRDLVLDLSASGTLAQLRDRVDARLRFAGARLPDITRFNRYLPKNGIQFLSGTGRVGADMRMQVAQDRNGGTLSLRTSSTAIRLGEMVLRGDLSVDARLEAGRLDDREFALPGTRVEIRQAAVMEPPGERVEQWWGKADITHGKVVFSEPIDLSARADVQMRDVAPLLSLFAQNKRFPRWIRRLIDAGEARVSGELEIRDDRVIVDHVFASNDRFDVQARMLLGEAPPSGQLYARWGVLGTAVELERGERKFHVVGAKKWFEEQPAYLPRR